jgi:hypothetical protein
MPVLDAFRRYPDKINLSVHMPKGFNKKFKVKPLSNRARFLALGISPEGKMYLKGYFS